MKNAEEQINYKETSMRLKRFFSNDLYSEAKDEKTIAIENALSKIANAVKALDCNMEFRADNYVYLYFYGNALKVKLYADGSGFRIEATVLKKYFSNNKNFAGQQPFLKEEINIFSKKTELKELNALLELMPQIQAIYRKFSNKELEVRNERIVECSLMKKGSLNSNLYLLDMEVVVSEGKEFNTSDTIVGNREGDIIAVVKGKAGYRFLPIELKLLAADQKTRNMAPDEIKTFINTIYGCITDKKGLFAEFKLNYEKIYKYKKNLKLMPKAIENMEIMDDRDLKPIGLILEIDKDNSRQDFIIENIATEEDKYLIYKLECSADTFLGASWMEKVEF